MCCFYLICCLPYNAMFNSPAKFTKVLFPNCWIERGHNNIMLPAGLAHHQHSAWKIANINDIIIACKWILIIKGEPTKSCKLYSIINGLKKIWFLLDIFIFNYQRTIKRLLKDYCESIKFLFLISYYTALNHSHPTLWFKNMC